MSHAHDSLRAVAGRIAAGTLSADEAMRAVVDTITAATVGDSEDPVVWSAVRRQVVEVVRGDPELQDLLSTTRWRPSHVMVAPPQLRRDDSEMSPDEPLFEGASQSRVARVAVGSFPVIIVGVLVVGLVAWGATIFSGDDPPPDTAANAAASETDPVQKPAEAREPAVIAGALAPTSAAIDEAFIWYTTAQPPAVGRVRNIGGEMTTLASEPDPGSIAQTAEHVFWLSRTPTGPLMRAIRKHSPTDPPVTIEVAPMRPAVATFWELEAAFVDETDGAIAKVSIAGGPPSKITAPLLPPPAALVSDATSIVWATAGVGATVGLVAREGGAPVVLATEQTDPRGLVLDETHVWWVDATAGALRRVPRAGGAIEAVVPGGVERFAFDTTSIFWSDAAAGTVSSRPRAGGEIAIVASAQKSPTWVLVDGAAVYWITAGRLLRLPK